MIYRRHFLNRVALAVLSAGFTVGAQAQTVTVRSGEHDNFSRLVLSVPVGIEWSTVATASGYRLTLDPSIAEIDLSEAFDRIPRDRIAALALSVGAVGLDIDVACVCHLESFLYRPDMLVIDVIDGAAPASVAAITTPSADSTLPERPPVTLVELSPRPVLPLFVAPPAATTTVLSDPFVAPAPRSEAMVATERAILESFARAASQGVFDFPAIAAPRPPTSGAQSVPNGSGLTPVTDPMDGLPVPPENGIDMRPGLILRTGIVRDETGEVVLEEPNQTCARVGRVDTQNWIDERNFYRQIGEGRFALTTETGRLVPQAALDQVRRYVAFGFGAEAADLLQQVTAGDDADIADEVRTLATLAEIVDGGAAPGSAVARAIGCGSSAAIWATLARGTLDGTNDAHRDATIVGFRDLPDSLRGHLGLRLAALFSEAGETLIADQIMDVARGEVTGGGVEAELAQAEIDGAARGPEAEIARLDAFAERSPRLSPETLTRLLDLTSEAGRASDPALIELAQTMRFEAEGTETEAVLAISEARALIVAGEISTALSLIAETSGVLGHDRFEALFVAAHIALTADADDGAFLNTALETPPADLPPQVQNDIAARLLSLGFPDLAQPFLAGPAAQATMEERRYLRAAAAGALGDVAATDLALEGMTDPRAQELRAAARDEVGDFTGAYEARDRIPAASDRLAGIDPSTPPQDAEPTSAQSTDSQAWRAGDWAGLETSNDALLSSASRAILSPSVPPGLETPLADRQYLLGRAEETRAMTQALLERFVIDPPEGG